MREDFDQKTKDILARRVGFTCSNPGCRKNTSGPQIDSQKAINIGVAAHIKAASKGGKRFDPSQTTEDRKSVDNGIWLCQSCAKLIDSDEARFTVEMLNAWKLQAETLARQELEENKTEVSSEEPNTIVVRYAKDKKTFAQWISIQLISQGYPVWCDLFNSEPGEDEQVLVNNLINSKAIKYLFVLSSTSNSDPELQKELLSAFEVTQKKGYIGFVIPVLIDKIPENDLTILLRGKSAIDFTIDWSKGLNSLLDYLENSGVKTNIEFTPSKANDLWRNQYHADKGLKFESEELLSNWFPICLPQILFFHELRRTNIGSFKMQTENLPYPAILHNIYLISFAKAEDFSEKLGSNFVITSSISNNLQDFLDGNFDQKLTKKDTSWNLIMQLLNDAWSRFFSKTNLRKYTLANNNFSYYFPDKFSRNGDNKVFFQGVGGKRTWRFLVGKHKNYYWHFGIQGRAMLHPLPAFLVKAHGLVSNDGLNIWESKEKLHTARRRWFKNWWNSEWRDRLLATMKYLSDEREFIDINLGSDIYMSISSSPLVFVSPVKYEDYRDTTKMIDIDDESNTDYESLDEGQGDPYEEDDL